MKRHFRKSRLYLCKGCNQMLPLSMYKVNRNGKRSMHCLDCLVLNSCGRTKGFVYQYLNRSTLLPIQKIENDEERLAAVKECAAKVRRLVEKCRQKRWEQHDRENDKK